MSEPSTHSDEDPEHQKRTSGQREPVMHTHFHPLPKLTFSQSSVLSEHRGALEAQKQEGFVSRGSGSDVATTEALCTELPRRDFREAKLHQSQGLSPVPTWKHGLTGIFCLRVHGRAFPRARVDPGALTRPGKRTEASSLTWGTITVQVAQAGDAPKVCVVGTVSPGSAVPPGTPGNRVEGKRKTKQKQTEQPKKEKTELEYALPAAHPWTNTGQNPRNPTSPDPRGEAFPHWHHGGL